VLFEGRPSLQRYLNDHLRFVHRVRWTTDATKRLKWEEDPWAIRRPVRYEVFERI
jgi:hypothetical protein